MASEIARNEILYETFVIQRRHRDGQGLPKGESHRPNGPIASNKSPPGQPLSQSWQKLLETRALGTRVPGPTACFMKIASYCSSLVVPFVAACSSTPAATVQLPPSLAIATIAVAGTSSDNTWTVSNPIQPELGCNGAPLIVAIVPVPINSVIDDFSLVVPGACGAAVSCGWIVLRVDPGSANEIYVPTWTSPITVEEAIEPGPHTFSIELHDASDQILLYSDGNPVGGQVTVQFVQSSNCPVVSDHDAG